MVFSSSELYFLRFSKIQHFWAYRLLFFNKNQKPKIRHFDNSASQKNRNIFRKESRPQKLIVEFGKKNQLTKINNVSNNDLFDYTDCIISIFINSPNFEGQTKKRVSMPGIQKQLENKLFNNFLLWLNGNKKEAAGITN